MDFWLPFGIMCITTRKERENDRPEAILPSKITPANLQSIFFEKSPENRGREICL